MQPITRIIPIMIGLSLLFMLAGTASAASLLITGGDSCIPVGSQTDLTVRLSDVPQGLSGLNISIGSSDPTTASVANVTFPDWAMLNTRIPLSSDTIGLKMVDLQQKINAGAKDVSICQVTVAARKSGTTVLTVTPVLVEDDAGGLYTVSPVKKTVCTEGSAPADPAPVSKVTGTPVPVQSVALSSTSVTPAPSLNPASSSVPVTVRPSPSGSLNGGTPKKTQPASKATTPVPQPSVTPTVPSPEPGLMPCLAVVALVGIRLRKKEEP
jgi:hypothetical protein